jgi:hypothetical protein
MSATIRRIFVPFASSAGSESDFCRFGAGQPTSQLGEHAGLVILPLIAVLRLAAAFVVGALSVMFDVAYQIFLVRLLDRDQLLRGKSAVESSRSAAQIGGPALGGALVCGPPSSRRPPR